MNRRLDTDTPIDYAWRCRSVDCRLVLGFRRTDGGLDVLFPGRIGRDSILRVACPRCGTERAWNPNRQAVVA